MRREASPFANPIHCPPLPPPPLPLLSLVSGVCQAHLIIVSCALYRPPKPEQARPRVPVQWPKPEQQDVLGLDCSAPCHIKLSSPKLGAPPDKYISSRSSHHGIYSSSSNSFQPSKSSSPSFNLLFFSFYFLLPDNRFYIHSSSWPR